MLSLDIRISVKVSDMKWILRTAWSHIYSKKNSIFQFEKLKVHRQTSFFALSTSSLFFFATLTNAFAWTLFTFRRMIIVNQIEIALSAFHDCIACMSVYWQISSNTCNCCAIIEDFIALEIYLKGDLFVRLFYSFFNLLLYLNFI